MKKILMRICFVFVPLLIAGTYVWLNFQKEAPCDFFRDEQCLLCDSNEVIPVGYKENCLRCRNRSAYYVADGLIPAWLCVLTQKDEPEVLPELQRSRTLCPSNRPLKDVVGNCYACDTDEFVRVGQGMEEVCGFQRYLLPDGWFEKSLKCPNLMKIKNAEICVACGGVVNGELCQKEGTNRFCVTNKECDENEWCYPFQIQKSDGKMGVCVASSVTKWICSETDGYNLKQAQLFCERQGAHLPTLEEIEMADENLEELCPTLDMWTFFEPDGVVWLQSFAQEFLFTREGESENLGGHQFYALCHKD